MEIGNFTFKDIVDKINNDLGTEFCDKFRYERKKLSNSGRASSANILFKFVDQGRDWVINEGGGVEIQYHLYYRQNSIGYGLGFNAQYVPFANEKSPVDYIRPFVTAFLQLKNEKFKVLHNLESNGFTIIEGNGWDGLNNIEQDDYYLFGKTIQIQNGVLSDMEYNQMLKDIKNELFDLYVAIWKKVKFMDKKYKTTEKYVSLLKANKNLILTGAPGTGKTYLAKQIAAQLILSKEFEEHTATDDEKNKMKEQFDFVQFHPSYDYTDFVEGLRPIDDVNGKIAFRREDGVFMRFCRKALETYSKAADKETAPKYVFIIDEINRGELSKIFGELFFCIDPGYRGEVGKVKTQYCNLWKDSDCFGGHKAFFIPENVYIIGTMNDIDRSVESMDFAMRRRFAFKEIQASETMEMIRSNDNLREFYPLIEERMKNLNLCILTIQGFSSAYQIGAAYFLKLTNYLEEDKLTEKAWENLWSNHLQGLLFEYLRGLPNADEELQILYRAFLLEEKYKLNEEKVVKDE